MRIVAVPLPVRLRVFLALVLFAFQTGCSYHQIMPDDELTVARDSVVRLNNGVEIEAFNVQVEDRELTYYDATVKTDRHLPIEAVNKIVATQRKKSTRYGSIGGLIVGTLAAANLLSGEPVNFLTSIAFFGITTNSTLLGGLLGYLIGHTDIYSINSAEGGNNLVLPDSATSMHSRERFYEFSLFRATQPLMDIQLEDQIAWSVNDNVPMGLTLAVGQPMLERDYWGIAADVLVSDYTSKAGDVSQQLRNVSAFWRHDLYYNKFSFQGNLGVSQYQWALDEDSTKAGDGIGAVAKLFLTYNLRLTSSLYLDWGVGSELYQIKGQRENLSVLKLAVRYH